MSGPDPDAALIARVAAGEGAAYRQLVAAKLPRLHGLAARLLRDRAEAEDVVQEVFVRAWRQAPRWRPDQARFDTWLHLVTLNLCRDRLRRARRRLPAPPVDPSDPAPRQDEALIEADRAAAVSAAIGGLPERQRDAILLVHYQDLSNGAAAELLGVSVDALESLLARGRRRLRARLMEKDDD